MTLIALINNEKNKFQGNHTKLKLRANRVWGLSCLNTTKKVLHNIFTAQMGLSNRRAIALTALLIKLIIIQHELGRAD